jgi:hypothetical protein
MACRASPSTWPSARRPSSARPSAASALCEAGCRSRATGGPLRPWVVAASSAGFRVTQMDDGGRRVLTHRRSQVPSAPLDTVLTYSRRGDSRRACGGGVLRGVGSRPGGGQLPRRGDLPLAPWHRGPHVRVPLRVQHVGRLRRPRHRAAVPESPVRSFLCERLGLHTGLCLPELRVCDVVHGQHAVRLGLRLQRRGMRSPHLHDRLRMRRLPVRERRVRAFLPDRRGLHRRKPVHRLPMRAALLHAGQGGTVRWVPVPGGHVHDDVLGLGTVRPGSDLQQQGTLRVRRFGVPRIRVRVRRLPHVVRER